MIYSSVPLGREPVMNDLTLPSRNQEESRIAASWLQRLDQVLNTRDPHLFRQALHLAGIRNSDLEQGRNIRLDQLDTVQLFARERFPDITLRMYHASDLLDLGLIGYAMASSGTVRKALQEHASALEEGKADVLGAYMVTWLSQNGELPGVDLRDNYVTFLGSIFRSIRFGSSSAHGVANLIRFNYFGEKGAFSRDPESGTYRVDFETKLRWELVKDFFWDLTYYDNYDSKPPSGQGATNDYGIVTSLGWKY